MVFAQHAWPAPASALPLWSLSWQAVTRPPPPFPLLMGECVPHLLPCFPGPLASSGLGSGLWELGPLTPLDGPPCLPRRLLSCLFSSVTAPSPVLCRHHKPVRKCAHSTAAHPQELFLDMGWPALNLPQDVSPPCLNQHLFHLPGHSNTCLLPNSMSGAR